MEDQFFSRWDPMVDVAITKTKPTVLPTTAQQAASQQTARKDDTGAPYVKAPTMVLNPAHQSSLLPIITPLRADAWDSLLRSCNLYHIFADIPHSIRSGFDMGVHSSLHTSYTPPNHQSALTLPSIIKNHINNELSNGRYTGPFSKSRLENLIGPFRTSPLGTVPKSNSTTEFRIIQDLSFPRDDPDHLSVNSEINSDLFPCDWGTFNQICEIVRNAPPDTEAAMMDVDAAFRCCPIKPEHQPHFVVHWEDSFYIDHNAPFGASSSGGIFGRLADAMTAIIHHHTSSPCKNWVDDFVLFRSSHNSLDHPNPFTYYELSLILDIADELGWPWKASKTRPFASSFRYLGFIWDLNNKTVEIPEDKKLKYLRRLDTWDDTTKLPRKEVETTLGTLVHCSLAIPDGRSRLPSLARFASSFNNKSRFSKCSPNKTTLADIKWWRLQLSLPFCGSPISNPPQPSIIEFWVDASTSWGIGVVFNNEWDSWKLADSWDSNQHHNIGWAEIIAINCGLRLAVHHGFTNIHFTIKSDNMGVIGAIEGGKSRNPEHNHVLQQITTLLRTNSIWLSSLYIPSKLNIADKPSRGIPLDNIPRSSDTFPLPPYLTHFLIPQPLLPTRDT